MSSRPSPICYLCGKLIEDDSSDDHVPPKQFFAEQLRQKHNPNLLTLPAHRTCNESYKNDEDYFVFSLMPFARGSYAGDPLRERILDGCTRHPEQAKLLNKVLNEFERQPSGLILPPKMVLKRFEGERISRVVWKIVRGLYFFHFGVFVPENAPTNCEIVLPDQKPPDHFFFLLDGPSHGKYSGVFDYTFKCYPETHNLNYWAMLLWDRITVIFRFQFPACNCEKCANSVGKPKANG